MRVLCVSMCAPVAQGSSQCGIRFCHYILTSTHCCLFSSLFIYLFDIFSHIYIYTHTYIFTYSAVGYFMECKVKNWGFEGKLVCSALSPGSFLQGFSLSKGILCNGSSLPYEFDFK